MNYVCEELPRIIERALWSPCLENNTRHLPAHHTAPCWLLMEQIILQSMVLMRNIRPAFPTTLGNMVMWVKTGASSPTLFSKQGIATYSVYAEHMTLGEDSLCCLFPIFFSFKALALLSAHTIRNDRKDWINDHLSWWSSYLTFLWYRGLSSGKYKQPGSLNLSLNVHLNVLYTESVPGQSPLKIHHLAQPTISLVASGPSLGGLWAMLKHCALYFPISIIQSLCSYPPPYLALWLQPQILLFLVPSLYTVFQI